MDRQVKSTISGLAGASLHTILGIGHVLNLGHHPMLNRLLCKPSIPIYVRDNAERIISRNIAPHLS